jgi:hypothetical protein
MLSNIMSGKGAAGFLGNLSMSMLILGILGSCIGIGYLIYGKKQKKASALLAGVILLIMPFMTLNIWIVCGVSIIAISLPFFIKF